MTETTTPAPTPEMNETELELLYQIDQLNEEAKAIAPRIWDACHAEASRQVQKLVRDGKLNLVKMAKTRENITRKLALEQLVNFGLAEGMTKENFNELFGNVLGEEGHAALRAGRPPERVTIDDLRARVYVITQLDPPSPPAAPQSIDVPAPKLVLSSAR